MKPFTKNLQKGSIGKDVLQLQNCLERLGYGDFIPTGVFGLKTQNALAKFQKANKITPSVGYFGNQTRAKINAHFFPRKEILWAVAVSLLGVDASPADRADDAYGCADTVNEIHKLAFGFEIGGTVRTAEMINYLRANKDRFEKVAIPEKGDIVISPTEGAKVGHVGIMFDNRTIMSNSSASGTWEKNFTVDSWRDRYVNRLKLQLEFFKLK